MDTSGFYALLVEKDDAHQHAVALLAIAGQSGRRFVTSDYVLDETATLLRARHMGHLVEAFFGVVFGSTACRLEWMDPDRFAQTQALFLKHQDQEWSFTDCFSFWLMRTLGMRDALTTDGHFHQAGFHAMLR